jgi:hypothetical protein
VGEEQETRQQYAITGFREAVIIVAGPKKASVKRASHLLSGLLSADFNDGIARAIRNIMWFRNVDSAASR